MEFIYLLLVNFIFCGFVFFYFQRKYELTIRSGKIKRELEELVILFNQQAEKNITILEAKVKEVQDITKRLEKEKLPIKVNKEMVTKEMVTYNVYPIEEIDKVEDVAIISQKKPLKSKVKKSVNKKKKLVDELKLEYEAGVSKKKLAEKFNLSVEEVTLRLNLTKIKK